VEKTTERIRKVLEELGLLNDETEGNLELIASRALGLLGEGHRGLTDAVKDAVTEITQGGIQADQEHGSAFREESQ